MDAAAKMTSKGQVTVPKAVRYALGLAEGDEVIFRVEGHRAVLARTKDFSTSPARFRSRPPNGMLRGTTWSGALAPIG